MKLNHVYTTGDEKLIKTTIIYGKKADDYVYADVACKEKLDKATLLRLCLIGATVCYESAFYPVVAFKANEENGCEDVTFYDAYADSAAAVTLHSSEYTA